MASLCSQIKDKATLRALCDLPYDVRTQVYVINLGENAFLTSPAAFAELLAGAGLTYVPSLHCRAIFSCFTVPTHARAWDV
jgi:hypothetical protein